MEPETTVARHDALYFDDGNIALAATLADDAGSVVFKVHKSVMAAHSPVFADMFSLPDAGTAAETYDGVPLIRMPDPAEDLQRLLEALYCKPPFSLVPFSPQTPSVARPVLALSTKYEITHLRQLIVERLEADWPQTLDKWDELEDAIASRREAYMWRLYSPCVDDLFPEPASAMRLAHDFNIPQILPAIFYHLLRIPIENDWALLHEDDPGSTPAALSWGQRTAKWDLLRKQELLLMLRSRQELINTMHRLVLHVDLKPAHADDALCEKTANVILVDLAKDCMDELKPHDCCEDALSLLRPSTQAKKKTEWEICPPCKAELADKIKGVRLAIWEQLPHIFGLVEQGAEIGA